MIYYAYYVVLVISLIVMLTVLGLGFLALIKDRGNRSLRTVTLLKWRARIGLWVLFMLFLGIGTGILSPGAPWDGERFESSSAVSY